MDSAFSGLHRILAGEMPWGFLGELVVRALVLYFVLMVSMRVLGRRIAAQLTLFELSMAVTLAAAAGVALQDPNRGLVPAALVMLVTVAIQRLVSRWGIRERRVEHLVSGRVVTLVRDGRLVLSRLRRGLISREKIFAQLRDVGVQHLGEVSRLYLEASGEFSLVRARSPQPGLSVLPRCDAALRDEARVDGTSVCNACGNVLASATVACDCCGARDPVAAARRLER